MTYRKWGRTVRYENGITIQVQEAGEATEIHGVFRAAPIEARRAQLRWAELPWEAAGNDDGSSAQRSWALRVPDRVTTERLIVSSGIAQHETAGVTWYEESMRVHLALANPPLRALIDLASFDLTIIETIASALARAGDERDAPLRVRLAPNVSAALLPSLIGELAIEQSGGGFDGKGQTIETRAVTSGEPPNWYRPVYAVRPIRAWLNIRALPFGSIDRNAPLAVALLGPLEGAALRVLCVDGDDVYPATINAAHIAAVSRDEAMWYPYAAGSFGVEMML